MVYWLTVAVLVVYLIVVWLVGSWLHPTGSGMWMLRGGLALIGIAAALCFVYFRRKMRPAGAPAAGSASASGSTGDIDLLVHEAVRRLKASAVGRGATVRNLPLVFLLGDAGSTKTSTIIQSALDPELLAGHVYQDTTVLPTRLANIWYTRQAIFVDTAGALASQP